MEDMISAIKTAAEQLAIGQPLNMISTGNYQLYQAFGKDGQEGAIICVVAFEEYFGILDSAASELGLNLEEQAKLQITLPEAEFGEDMVTGGFENYKGISVEHHNECLEELMVAVCSLLKERGLAVACVPDEDVLFYMPLGRG